MAQVKKPQSSTSTRKTRKPTSGASKPQSKSKSKTQNTNRPPPKQVKTKRAALPTSTTSKPKPRKYTDAQLNLPAINSIIPASATGKTGRGTGKKRKVYVDDAESMMTILAMVNAEKEGAIESKVLRARQLEEIREARRKEAEKRAETKRVKLEGVKMDIKRGRKGMDVDGVVEAGVGKGKDKRSAEGEAMGRKKRKSVSFA